MQRIDGPTRSAVLPAPNATGTGGSAPGYFAHGDPLTGTPYTTLDPDWCNSVQEEILAPIVAAGLTPDKTNRAQLLAALNLLFVSNATGGVHIGTDQCSIPLPGGFVLKFGQHLAAYNEQAVTIPFDSAFPTACRAVVAMPVNSTGGNTRDVFTQLESMSVGSFTAFLQKSGGTGNTDSTDGIVWIAIGN